MLAHLRYRLWALARWLANADDDRPPLAPRKSGPTMCSLQFYGPPLKKQRRRREAA